MFNLNFGHVVIALLAIALLCCLGLGISIIICTIQAKKPETNTEKNRLAFNVRNYVLLGLFTIIIFLITTLIISYVIASSHGLYTTDLTLNQLYTGIQNTPVEDELPNDITGTIIIFYKFGCTDCDAIYEDLSAYIDGKSDIYWVSSRSEQGKTLLTTYPVESVPTAIYIHVNSDDNAYTKKALHYTDENGDTKFDMAAIDRLLYLQEQDR